MGRIASRILIGTAGLVLAASFGAAAQTVTGHRVGVLVPQPLPLGWEEKAFREALRDLGYREGVNLFIDIRSANGKLDQLPMIASELVRSGVHVIVALNTPGTRAAIGATRTVPIVMAEVGDPVATGFVSNLARPEGNVTGVSNMCGELAAKRLSLLREAVPGARRIAVMLNPDDPITAPQIKDAERAAPLLGVEVRFFPVRMAAEVDVAFERVRAWRANAAMWLCGQQFALERRSASLTPKHGLPVMSYRSDAIRSGAVLSYAPDRQDLMRRAATYVDKILKGAKPADLPVDQPTTLELVVNLKAARALGIAIPETVLLRADRIVE